jgi:hypothetical protein
MRRELRSGDPGFPGDPGLRPRKSSRVRPDRRPGSVVGASRNRGYPRIPGWPDAVCSRRAPTENPPVRPKGDGLSGGYGLPGAAAGARVRPTGRRVRRVADSGAPFPTQTVQRLSLDPPVSRTGSVRPATKNDLLSRAFHRLCAQSGPASGGHLHGAGRRAGRTGWHRGRVR